MGPQTAVVWRLVGLSVAAALLAAACQAPTRPAATASSSSSVPPSRVASVVVGQVAPPTGFRGGVLTGIGLTFDPGEGVEDWAWKLPAVAPEHVAATVRFTTELLNLNCESFPARLACPAPEDAVLLHRLSGLWDLDRRVVFQGVGGTSGRVDIYRAGPGRQEDDVDFALPGAERGAHCLVLAAFEDDATIVEGQFPDHSNSGLWLVSVGSDDPDRCGAPDYEGRWWPMDEDGIVLGDCAEPFLTDRPRQYAAGVAADTDGLWAVLPRCGTPGTSFAVFAVDGVLQGAGDTLAPFRIPATDAPGVVVPVDRSDGWLRVLVAARRPGNDHGPRVLRSRPWLPNGMAGP